MSENQAPAPHLPEPDAAWRKHVEERFQRGDERFKQGDQKFDLLQAEMESNTEITREIREIVLMGRTVFRAFSGIGKALVWCWSWIYKLVRVGGALAAAGTAIWAAVYAYLHGGQPPK